MKRRNADLGKVRRPMKRNKIAEGLCSSQAVVYMKFLMIWVLVVLADFILEFRFEFLWPFYLLLRSVYDSFRYQGLAFSVFFVCVALTSDVLCFFFIPVHWLFFMASTYVWVQYIWHTDRSVCVPTVLLWLVFVYLEAAVRLRDIKNMYGHLDLCRPFAAHCVGYPVVTLGFGFKSYIGYRMRQRRQRDVAKENEFYQQLLLQALPVDPDAPSSNEDLESSTNPSPVGSPSVTASTTVNANTCTPPSSAKQQQQQQQQNRQSNGHVPNGTAIPNGVQHHPNQQNQQSNHHNHKNHRKSCNKSNGVAVGAGTDENVPNCAVEAPTEPPRPSRRREKREMDKEREAAEYLQRLETDVKKLRSDLQSSRQSEQELRLQVVHLTTSEKVSKGELCSLQREIEEFQSRLQSAMSTRAADRQSIGSLERRLNEERRLRSSCEAQLNQERKNRKQEEARAAAAQVAAQTTRLECTEACKARRRDLESEVNERLANQRWAEERIQVLERENAVAAEQLHDTDLLVSAFAALQEKNAHLENSLSAETRIKLDLFSALGEVKRQLEIRENTNRAQEKEIEELKSKIAQVLAVMPHDSFVGGPPTPSNAMSRVRLAESPPSGASSTLDPNATAYTPKGSSLVTSMEA